MTNYEKIKAMSIEEMAEYLQFLRLECDTVCVAQDAFYKNHNYESEVDENG